MRPRHTGTWRFPMFSPRADHVCTSPGSWRQLCQGVGDRRFWIFYELCLATLYLRLSIIFFLEKSYKKAVIFLLPGVLYVIYFSRLRLYPSVGRRIDHSLTLGALVKKLYLAVFTFLDSAVVLPFGQNLVAIGSIGCFPWCCLVVASFMVLYFRSERGRIPATMFWGLLAVCCYLSECFHWQAVQPDAFNLGNRVTVTDLSSLLF